MLLSYIVSVKLMQETTNLLHEKKLNVTPLYYKVEIIVPAVNKREFRSSKEISKD